MSETVAPILDVRGLTVTFEIGEGLVPAVRGTDWQLRPGEVLALVGESGSGKSVTALSLLGLLPDNAAVAGSIHFDGTDLVAASAGELRAVRGKRIAIVFQDPSAALDPVFTIGAQIDEVLRLGEEGRDRATRRSRAIELLAQVELPNPESQLTRYPHQLSGGQLQRVMIAMALAGSPDVLIADEPTTALDVTVQRGVLDLLRRLNRTLGMSILLITHDMGVVADLADRVVVMRHGVIVEQAETIALFEHPSHEYTRMLLGAVPTHRAALATAGPAGITPAATVFADEPGATDELLLRVEIGRAHV